METNNRREPGWFCARKFSVTQLASACLIICTAVSEAGAQSPATPPLSPQVPQRLSGTVVEPRAAYAKLPLSFVPNAGQLDTRVRYSAQSGGATFYFTTREAVSSFARKAKGLVLRLRFLGANPKAAITGQTTESGTVSYIIGNDPARWHTDLPTYRELVYRDLWPGIDLLFRSDNGQLQYEFLLRPGARVRDIQLAYRGANRLSIDRDGNLMVHTSLGSITDTRPVTYQLIDGKRVQVASGFALQRGTKTRYGFTVGAYDHSRGLIVDPGLVYSTFLGGAADDAGNGIAVDSAGQAYVTGNTYSADFPTTSGAYDRTYNGSGGFAFGSGDVFVTKLNSNGSALIYSTYLGGSGNEPIFGASIAVDSAGNAYVTGTTDSANFPVTPGAYQSKLTGIENVFVTKLNKNGSNLIYSTYLGGSGQDDTDFYSSIAVDSSGNAYVTGFTSSSDYPITPSAFQTSNHGGFYDAFVTKLNSSGSALIYSTYLGGTADEGGLGIALDGDGRAIVTGYTHSPDFPTTPNAAQPTIGGGYDAFVTKLNASGTALVYSTFLGGTLDDAGGSIATDWCGNAYVTGSTNSPNFPTSPNAFQKTPGGGFDAFVTKLNASGSALAYSTYLGGLADEQGDSIAVDSAGQAYVAGFTNSPNFRVTADAFQPMNNGSYDAFVTKFNSAGSALVYSTYLGGAVDDFGNGIALSRSRKVFVSGSTDSADFPTTSGAFDTSYNGGTSTGDAFVTKLDVPTGEVGSDKADGDGEADEQNSGRKSHFHFHKGSSSCPDQNDSKDENVQADDDGSGPRFQSTSITSATYSVADQKQSVTMVGAGMHNGLPVNFTVVAVNYGDVAPGVFQIILTDGYSFIGSVVSGGINIQ
jgi:hypothetical protein